MTLLSHPTPPHPTPPHKTREDKSIKIAKKLAVMYQPPANYIYNQIDIEETRYLFFFLSLSLCMYVFIYIYMYTYKHIHIYIYLYMYINKYIYIYMYVYIYIYVYIYVYIYIHIYYVYIYIHIGTNYRSIEFYRYGDVSWCICHNRSAALSVVIQGRPIHRHQARAVAACDHCVALRGHGRECRWGWFIPRDIDVYIYTYIHRWYNII